MACSRLYRDFLPSFFFSLEPALALRVENAVAALVLVQGDQVVASVGEVLTRIVVLGVLDKVLADGSSHGKTTIRVDVDLADGALHGLTDLVLRDTDSVLDLAAKLVDGLHVLLGNGGRAVENDREARDASLDLVKNVETQVRLGARRELHNTVARADGDGKRVHTGALDKVDDLVGVSVVAGLSLHVVLDTGKNTELTLDSDVVLMGIVDNLLGEGNVLLVGESRTVDHDVAEAAGDAVDAKLVAVTVVKVESDGDALAVGRDLLGVLNGTLSHVAQKSLVRIGTSTTGNLKNHRALSLNTGSDDGLHLLHVVEVESRDSKTVLHSTGEHLLGVHEAKILVRNLLACHSYCTSTCK